jgi:hypothetical protein
MLPALARSFPAPSSDAPLALDRNVRWIPSRQLKLYRDDLARLLPESHIYASSGLINAFGAILQSEHKSKVDFLIFSSALGPISRGLGKRFSDSESAEEHVDHAVSNPYNDD